MQTSQGIKVGDTVLAVFPYDDHPEVCKVRSIVPGRDGNILFSVEDVDGVRDYVKRDAIIRKA